MSHLEENQRYDDLIQRALDGDISELENSALRDHVAANAESRSLQVDLTRLVEILDRVEAIDPPSGLGESVLAALASRRLAPTGISRARFRTAKSPFFKYGYAFAAGLILGFVLDQFLFNQTFTLPAPEVRGSMVPRVPEDHLSLNSDGLSGSINLRASGSDTFLEFDLNSQKVVEFKVEFDSSQIGFKGFNQLMADINSFSARPGRIIIQCEGKHRFALQLAKLKDSDANMNLGVFISGKLVQNSNLRLPKSY